MAQSVMKWGKVVACYDDWPVSDAAFLRPNSNAATYVTNIVNWFKGGRGGRFLALTDNVCFQGSHFPAAVQSNGGTLERTTTVPSDFSVYDGIFLCYMAVDNNRLLDYVNAGGCVYIAGGTASDGTSWDSLLGHFGMSLSNSIDGFVGDAAVASSDHPVMRGVSRLYFVNGSPLSLAPSKPSWALGPGVWGNKVVVAAADVNLVTETWNDGVIEITHQYRSAIRKNYIIPGGTVTIKNLTTQVSLTNVKVSIDADNANDNLHWAVWTCNGAGQGMRYRNIPVAAVLAPGQSASQSYFYTTTPIGDLTPGQLSVGIHIMPQYTVAYQKDSPVGSIPVQASGSAAADGAVQVYDRPIEDVDGLIRIAGFQYVPTVAETSDARMIGGPEMTFQATILFAAKQLSLSVAVEPSEDSVYWDASSCDPSGNDAYPPPWQPPAARLTAANRTGTFSYQYNLEANVDASMKEDFTINLHLLPQIIVNYLAVDAFTTTVQAND